MIVRTRSDMLRPDSRPGFPACRAAPLQGVFGLGYSAMALAYTYTGGYTYRLKGRRRRQRTVGAEPRPYFTSVGSQSRCSARSRESSSFMSASLSVKSNTAMFSSMCSRLADRGIGDEVVLQVPAQDYLSRRAPVPLRHPDDDRVKEVQGFGSGL